MDAPHNPNIKYRPDIDGLRTLAVIPVVMFHAGILPLARGGFIGVDVFFVISGFLITRILHKEIFEKNNFSVINFYYRRTRRILPAAIPVYIFSIILAVFIFFPDEQNTVYNSVLSSITFCSNIYFFLTSNYFDNSSAMNPLLHTWSLSVEEQFYFVIPPIMILISRVAKSNVRRFEIMALSTIALISFASACLLLNLYPEAVFYLLPFRAWELLVGSLVGIGAIPLHRSGKTAQVAALAGIAAIGGSVLFLHEGIPFPGIAALPAVLGSALIIHAGLSHPKTAGGRLLGIWPLRFIGLCSYSIYLWHWPFVVFYPFVFGEPTLVAKIGIVLFSILAGFLSWAVIEQPFRTGPWLSTPGKSFIRVGAGMAVAAALAILAPALSRTLFPLPALAREYLAQSKNPGHYWRSGTCFLSDSSNDRAFPEQPCLDEVPGKRNVMLFGDSHAAQYYPALSKLPDFHILQATASGCRPIGQGSGSHRCSAMMAEALKRLGQKNRIEAVILAGRWQPEDAKPLVQRINMLTGRGYRVIVLGPVPEYSQPVPRLMALKAGKPDLVMDKFLTLGPEESEAIIARAVAGTKGIYVSTRKILCPDKCIALADSDHVMQFDYGHLTLAGSDFVIAHALPAMRSSL